MNYLRLLFCIFISSTSVVAAQDIQMGFNAYHAGNYEKALEQFRPLAEQGNADAQAAFGLMYDEGSGVSRDAYKAVRWYRLALLNKET